MFTFIFCIFLTIAVFCLINLFYYKKLYKPAVKHSHERTEVAGLIWFLLNLILVLLFSIFWFYFSKVVYKCFDMREPVCIEHVGTYPIRSHWSNPEILFVDIPEDAKRFCVSKNGNDIEECNNVIPGKRFYLDDYSCISINKDSLKASSGPSILVNFYIFNYKSWGPFTVPSFLNPGLATIGVPEIYNIGKCEIHATLKE